MIHRFQFSANCRRYVVAIAIVSAALGSVATAEDWPQWRGANRDGRWTEILAFETICQMELCQRYGRSSLEQAIVGCLTVESM